MLSKITNILLLSLLCTLCVSTIFVASANAVGVCGNGIMDAGEECDDKNTKSADGCSNTCKIESGFACKNAPNINTGTDKSGGTQTLGSKDLVWSWSATLGGSSQSATVAGNCAKGAWINAPSGSRWINRYGCSKSSPQNADTYYTATFSIANSIGYGGVVLDPKNNDVVYAVLKSGGLLKLELSTFNNYVVSW